MQLNLIKQFERQARNNPDIISLGQGIPSSRADDRIHQAVIEALQSQTTIDTYSDPAGIPELRMAIAGQLRQAGMQYNHDEVIITAGAIEGLNVTLQTLITSERCEVVMPTPCYSAYSRAIALAGGTVVAVQLNESEQWSLASQDIIDRISTKTAAILLCNPNNPTGTVYDEITLRAIMDAAVQHDIPVIVDEVYGNMTFLHEPLYSPAQDPAYKSHVVRIVSFSKDFNLTGWRIGFMHTSSALVTKILPVHDTLINCAPVVSQYAALAALNIAPEIIARNKAYYYRNLQLMQQQLAELKELVDFTVPAGGYFFFPRLHTITDDVAFCQELASNGVIVIPGSDFGAQDGQHVRLCFGRSTEDITLGMKRFVAHIKGGAV